METKIKTKIYNIVKWIVFVGLIIKGFAFFLIGGFGLFWTLSAVSFFGPRLDSGMERVYFGKQITDYDIKQIDSGALTLLILEVLVDIFIL